MISSPQAAIDIQPGALLAIANAETTIETLNSRLCLHGLCLPIVPLASRLTLAELVGQNAGGRRQLAYGTIACYLRAATVQSVAQIDNRGSEEEVSRGLLRLGGPTLKRATGYSLPRAIVARGDIYLPGVNRLIDITVNVRPLPPARCEVLLTFPTLPLACQFAARLISARLALSALAVRDGVPSHLLVELEGHETVLKRQAHHVVTLAEQAGASLPKVQHHSTAHPQESLWRDWEALADTWQKSALSTLTLNLPRATMPAFIEQAQSIARRYGVSLSMWGDAGVGTLHLCLDRATSPPLLSAGEIQQVEALLIHLAQRLGGAVCSESPKPKAENQKRNPFPVPTISRQSPIPTLSSLRSSPHRLPSRLQALLGPQHLLTRPGDLVCYDRDASIARAEGQPLAVVLPGSTTEVSTVLQLAAEASVPVVTRGAGSGLAGGSTPSSGALVVVLTQMQHIRIDAAQQVAHVEAGAITADIQRAAEAHGLMYAPDPSSQSVSTIGGNIACNAGGPRCLKYGVTSTYVLELTAVLADGSILRMGDGIAGQTPDAGLMHLLIGSEGTLAIITEATLRLIARPAAQCTVLAFFDRLDDACTTVEAIMASGVLPAGLELMDDTSLHVVEDMLHLGLPCDAEALLLMLSDGEPEAVVWETRQLAELAQRGGARTVQVAKNAADEAAFWRARRAVAPAFARVCPNRLGEDICVPLTQIAATVRRIKAIASKYAMPIPVFGHAGDGNLHPNILFDARDPAQVMRAWQAAEEIFLVALEHGGTLSGEHGIGTLKRPFLAAALGEEVLALHRAIKAQFDPEGRLNPGKVV